MDSAGCDGRDEPPERFARARVFVTGQGRKTDPTDALWIALVGTRMVGCDQSSTTNTLCRQGPSARFRVRENESGECLGRIGDGRCCCAARRRLGRAPGCDGDGALGWSA